MEWSRLARDASPRSRPRPRPPVCARCRSPLVGRATTGAACRVCAGEEEPTAALANGAAADLLTRPDAPPLSPLALLSLGNNVGSRHRRPSATGSSSAAATGAEDAGDEDLPPLEVDDDNGASAQAPAPAVAALLAPPATDKAAATAAAAAATAAAEATSSPEHSAVAAAKPPPSFPQPAPAASKTNVNWNTTTTMAKAVATGDVPSSMTRISPHSPSPKPSPLVPRRPVAPPECEDEDEADYRRHRQPPPRQPTQPTPNAEAARSSRQSSPSRARSNSKDSDALSRASTMAAGPAPLRDLKPPTEPLFTQQSAFGSRELHRPGSPADQDREKRHAPDSEDRQRPG